MTEFVTYLRDRKTYEVVASGADMYGNVPPQDGTDGQCSVVIDLTPERNYHVIESAEAMPAVLRAYVGTIHMTVTEFHQAEYRPVVGGWTPSGYETWAEVTVDNNGGSPITTWVRTDGHGWLRTVPKHAGLA